MKFFKAFLSLLCLTASSFFSYAQGNDPTTWTYETKKINTTEYQLIFHCVLKEGFHVFSQKPGDDFLIPPSFKFKKNPAFKLTGAVVEQGKMKTEKMDGVDNPIHYYEGSVDFIQKVKITKPISISGEHEYQVCNDKMCLPPKKKNFVFELK
jgi:thiol:disulfide interchange protein DsbD